MNITIIGGADGPTSIFLAGKLGNTFSAPAFFILFLFYGTYFAKAITLKRQGIKTSQLGHGKAKPVRITEIILSAATVLIVPVQAVSVLFDWNIMPTWGRIAGIAAGLTGDLLFLAAVITMKNSWRAGIPESGKTEFVSRGIYKYSRNPAFLGFDLMYAGILFMYFNWLSLFFSLWAAVMLHLQILQEEKYLLAVFGGEYSAYTEHTCRYLGRKSKEL